MTPATMPSWLSSEIERASALRYSPAFLRALYQHLQERQDAGNTVVSAVLSMASVEPVLQVIYTNKHTLDDDQPGQGADAWHVGDRSSMIGGRHLRIRSMRLDSFWNGAIGGVGGPGPVEYLMNVITGVNVIRNESLEATTMTTAKNPDWAEFTSERLMPSVSAAVDRIEEFLPRIERAVMRDFVKELQPAATEALAAILLSVSPELQVPYSAAREPLDELMASPLYVANLLSVGDVRLLDRSDVTARLPGFLEFCRNFRVQGDSPGDTELLVHQKWKGQWRDSFDSLIYEIHKEVTNTERLSPADYIQFVQ